MNEHWQILITAINQNYGIVKKEDWLADNKSLLKTFQSALAVKVKAAIINSPIIAKAFLGVLTLDFIEKSSEEKTIILDTFIIHKKIQNPKIDIRTLEKILCINQYSNHQRIANMFAIYVFDTLFNASLSLGNPKTIESINITRPQKILNQKEKLAQFYGTFWWVYYHDNDAVEQTTKIGRAILTIKDESNVHLTNKETATSTHYEGIMELESSHQHLYFDLAVPTIKDKHLQMTFYIGIGKAYPLLLGIYTNISGDNTMVAGSMILEKIDHLESIKNRQPKSLSLVEAKAAGIDEIIITFLKDRENNHIKIRAGIFSKAELKAWKERQIKRNQDKTNT